MSRSFLVILVALSCLLSSCFSTYQVESVKRVDKQDAHLTIYRQGIYGYAVGTKIYANGKFIGKVGVNRYVSCWLPEGEYLLSVRMTKSDEVFFKVRMTAGRSYAYSFSYSFFRDGGRPRIRKMEDVGVISHRRPPMVNYFD